MTDKNPLGTGDPVQRMRQELSAADDREQGKAAKRRSPRSRVIKIIETVVFAFVVILLFLVLFSVLSTRESGKTPEVFGYRLYKIESGSMEPTLRVGSIILSHKPKDASDLNEGDIITFTDSHGKTVTHRITQVIVSEEGAISYQTKGDNPINSPDLEPVTPQMVESVFVLKVPLT